MNRPAVRAGLIGGGAAAVVALLGLIPVCGCFSLLLEWLVFIGAGVLAAAWMLPPRQAGQGGREGALAGLITGAIGGLVNMLLAPVSLALSGGTQQILNQLPPESLQAFKDAGVDPSVLFGTGSVLGIGAVCCGIGLVVALALGALGGFIYASAKPQIVIYLKRRASSAST